MSGGVTIRRAVRGDAAAAAAIIEAALAEHGLPFEPEGRDADVANFGTREEAHDLVAEDDGAVAGIVSVTSHENPGVAWISKLFVARQLRRRGIGRALLEAAHAAARSEGFHTVGLRTRTLFREALALYAASGYVASSDADARALEAGDVVLYRPL